MLCFTCLTSATAFWYFRKLPGCSYKLQYLLVNLSSPFPIGLLSISSYYLRLAGLVECGVISLFWETNVTNTLVKGIFMFILIVFWDHITPFI